MSDNEKLIAEARSVVSWNCASEIWGQDDTLLEKLADALEDAEQRITDEITWWEAMREDHAEHLMILRDASLRRLKGDNA